MNGIDNTICLFTDLDKTLQRMSDADAGVLIKALFAHANGRDPEGLERSEIASILYPMVEDQMDRLAEYRKRKSSRNKEEQSGANGSKREQTGANESEQEQTATPYPYPIPNQSPESPDGDKEKPPTGAKRKPEPFEVLFVDTPELNQEFVNEAWEAWKEVRRRKKVPWTYDAARLNAKTLKKFSRGDPIRAVNILEQSTKNGWQGLFDLKDPGGGKGKIDWEVV